ncbi:unnamed protein product [Calypogeia fissa]
MMGLHQNYPVTWGAERMEGLTLDLGLDGMFSPLPTELNTVGVSKDSDPPSSWRGFLGQSQTEQHIVPDVNLDGDDGDDPCALLHSDSNCLGALERKPDMFELSLSYPPPLRRQHQRQQLVKMKVERENVEPSLKTVIPSLSDVDAASQIEESYKCWRNTTLELPRKELHLYGTVGDENMEEEFLDDDTMDDIMDDDCHEIEPDRCTSSSVLPVAAALQQRQEQGTYRETIVLDDTTDDLVELKPNRFASKRVLPATAAVQQQKQHRKIPVIILDDDTDDEDFSFDERDRAQGEVGSIPQSGFGGDSTRRGSEERFSAAPQQAMPLRHIKQHVRSSRNDEDYNACAMPSAVPDITTRQQQYGAEELENCETSHHHEAREPVQQQDFSVSQNPKRLRGHGDHDWLPSDLLDASHSRSLNEAKRGRGNGHFEHPDGIPEPAFRVPIDVPVAPSAVAGVQVQVQSQNPLIDVNLAIQEMAPETAEAFIELSELFKESEARASVARDEMKNWHPRINDNLHNDPPPPRTTLPVTTTRSQQSEEMESRRSFTSDLHEHTPNTPPAPATVNQGSSIVHEMENWRPLASDVQDDPLSSERSVTTSDFEQNDSPSLSSDFVPNDSPLATGDQPIFLQGGGPPCGQSDAATISECSPHPAAIEVQGHAGKRMSNADVVLYEPKQEPVESRRENIMSCSVVHIKQEPDLHCPDPVSITPVEVSSAATQCYSSRKLIQTALATFEAVRQQILRDPTYGQPIAEPQTPGREVNGRRLRADLKAASMMRNRGFWLNDSVRPIGEVPGVVVGDCFKYRIEMAVIGLHRAVQAGIAIVPVKFSPCGVTLASSVVLGVGDPYQDDTDLGDTVIYSGQGGLCGRTKESQDQELKRGNLALSNSLKFKFPVRLIRGHKMPNSQTGVLYSYDGLYQVTDMKYQTGKKLKKVYIFTLQRLPGQAPIQQAPMLPVYPSPLGSHTPGAGEPVQWTESAETKPLYLEKSPVA